MVRMKRTVVLSATVIVVLLLAAPSYADVLLTGADWQMNETSGQMIDSSGNNNNGDPTDVRQTGSRYVFNGSTSYVLVPDSDSLDPSLRWPMEGSIAARRLIQRHRLLLAIDPRLRRPT
jgi:hypothetical protein